MGVVYFINNASITNQIKQYLIPEINSSKYALYLLFQIKPH